MHERLTICLMIRRIVQDLLRHCMMGTMFSWAALACNVFAKKKKMKKNWHNWLSQKISNKILLASCMQWMKLRIVAFNVMAFISWVYFVTIHKHVSGRTEDNVCLCAVEWHRIVLRIFHEASVQESSMQCLSLHRQKAGVRAHTEKGEE